METAFSDFNIPEELMQYGMVLQINLVFARAPPSERLEQAKQILECSLYA